jgi:raffinose/stachyose/melibiose transport system permease protein
MGTIQKKRRSHSGIIYFFAIFWSVITIVPFLTTIFSSFKSNTEIFSNMLRLPEKWLVQNYYDALFGANILQSVINSTILGLGTAFLVIVVSMLAAYVFSRRTHFFVKPVYILFLTGLMLPVHTALIPLSKIAAGLRMIDSYLFLIFVYSAFQLPLAIFLSTAYMNTISRQMDEAATIDGCNTFGVLYHILFPMSAPVISTVAVLSFVYGYSELIFSIILLTSRAKFPVSRALLFFIGERISRMGPVFAAIVIAVIPMAVLYVVFHEKVQAGMVAGAVKG